MTHVSALRMFHHSYNARVKIVRQPKYKSYDLLGKEGIIKSTYGSSVAIAVDGVFNKSSGYGYFYLEPGDYLILDEFVDNNIMEENIMSHITNYKNIAKIKFVDDKSPNPRIYDYAKIEIAKAKAEALKISAEAEAEANEIIDASITDKIIEKIYAENWNGELPAVIGDSDVILPGDILN